jgi:hypothetical protein
MSPFGVSENERRLQMVDGVMSGGGESWLLFSST